MSKVKDSSIVIQLTLFNDKRTYRITSVKQSSFEKILHFVKKQIDLEIPQNYQLYFQKIKVSPKESFESIMSMFSLSHQLPLMIKQNYLQIQNSNEESSIIDQVSSINQKSSSDLFKKSSDLIKDNKNNLKSTNQGKHKIQQKNITQEKEEVANQPLNNLKKDQNKYKEFSNIKHSRSIKQPELPVVNQSHESNSEVELNNVNTLNNRYPQNIPKQQIIKKEQDRKVEIEAIFEIQGRTLILNLGPNDSLNNSLNLLIEKKSIDDLQYVVTLKKNNKILNDDYMKKPLKNFPDELFDQISYDKKQKTIKINLRAKFYGGCWTKINQFNQL